MPVFDKIFARDPASPNDIASNATITLFDVADPTKTPVTLTKVDGVPLANPYTVDRQGEGPAFIHDTLYTVGWEGGGKSGVFNSVESMRSDAIAARTASENSVLLAQDAQEAANAAASEAAAAAQADLEARIAAGNFKGEPGEQGLPGVNAVPADEAVGTYATTPGTATHTALTATIAGEVEPVRLRAQDRIRQERPHVTKPYSLPASFGWNPGVPVLYDGAKYFTNYDVSVRKNTGGTSRYVDTRITPNGQTGLAVAKLAAPVYAGATITTITVTPLASALNHGNQITVFSGNRSHIFIVNGARAAGDTAITVTSTTPTVDLHNGSDVASAWGKLNDAIVASVDGDTIYVINGGVVWRQQSTIASSTTKSLNIIGLNNPIFAMADKPAWTATAEEPGVYQTNRTNVLRVVDIGPDPLGYEYPKAASLADCGDRPGTWWQDAGGTPVYVHPLNGQAPTDNIVPLLLVAQFNFATTNRTTPMNVYLEGITVLGSQNGVKAESVNAQPLDFTAKNCKFLWAEQTSSNALNFLGRYAYLQNCVAAHAGADGFNYHVGSGGVMGFFVEINCEAHSNGLRHIGTASVPTMNATTAHDGIKGLRIGGKYHYVYGTPVADVDPGTQTVNLSCDAFDSVAPSGTYNAAFSAQDAGPEMWVIGSRAFGTENDLYSETGATLHAVSTAFDTKGGPGTLDVTDPR